MLRYVQLPRFAPQDRRRRRGAQTSAWAALLILAALTPSVSCRRSPQAATTNVVLISIDTCRADALGSLGRRPSVTPNLDRLAGEGVVFTNAVSPVPITLPAHCSLMTGLEPARHGVHFNLGRMLHPDVETLAEVLARRGVVTAAFVSSLVLDRRFGLDQGFALYEDDMTGRTRSIFGAERPGAETVALATRWLRSHHDKPFFLFVHLYEPHEPYQPPEAYARLAPGSPYLGEVATADAAVGELLDAIAALGLDRSTLVAVVGDHGEMLSEHGEETHTYFVYQGAIRIPIIMKPPRRPPAVRIDHLVGLIDVAPTICGLLGVPAMADSDGIDLGPLLLGNEPAPRQQPLLCESLTPTRYGASPLIGVLEGRWKYIHTTRPELYDLTTDPGEERNLAASAPTIVEERQQRLAQVLESHVSRAAGAAAATVDRTTERRLAALGYAPGPLDDVLEIDATSADPKDLIAVHIAHTSALQLIAQDRFAEAEPLARDVLAALPDSWEAHLNLGKVALGLGRGDEAVRLLERSLELKPAQIDALRSLGEALTGLGELDRAIDSYRRALPLDPEPPRAAVELACALLNQGADDEADRLVASSVAAGRGRPELLAQIARALIECGHPERAEILVPPSGQLH